MSLSLRAGTRVLGKGTRCQTEVVTILNRKFSTEVEEEVDETEVVDTRRTRRNVAEQMAVMQMIRSYQERGHLSADLDPLGISRQRLEDTYQVPEALFPRDRLPENYDKRFPLPKNCFIEDVSKDLTFAEIVNRLTRVYCGTVGIEFEHSRDGVQSQWVKAAFETPNAFKRQISAHDREEAVYRLARATLLEEFFERKWPRAKRFGLQGGESLVPGLLALIDKSATLGARVANIGVAHRGRLNILANVLKVPLERVIGAFANLELDDGGTGTGRGDVRYHMGAAVTFSHPKTELPFAISLVSNPSHLESVVPVTLGKTKAHQVFLRDNDGLKVFAILIHGDAAMAGQGIVMESLLLSRQKQFNTFGNFHIVINNQIGFTTDAKDGRSSQYCTDVAKIVGAPIFHVNAYDVDAVIHVMNVAARFRMEFKTDVVIDLVGYRKYGHNEADEPSFTQPLMYKKVKSMETILDLYSRKIIEEHVILADQFNAFVRKFELILEEKKQLADNLQNFKMTEWIDSPWPGYFKEESVEKDHINTGVNRKELETLAMNLVVEPPFSIHHDLKAHLTKVVTDIRTNKLDWPTVESLTLATILKDGIHVRLSGIDVQRGLHFQRQHSYNSLTHEEKEYWPLDYVASQQSVYEGANSPLSECANLGFEVGYSLVSPYQIVIAECPFPSSAQVFIDQYISSGQAKWARQSSLVLMVPHGLDGRGPELSSGYPERFLGLCEEDPEVGFNSSPGSRLTKANMIVCCLSSPAQLFHVLRRSALMINKKPLIIFTPKALARNEAFTCKFEDLSEKTRFKVYVPSGASGGAALLLCTGQLAVDLRLNGRNVGSIEQFNPFPFKEVFEDLNKQVPGASIIWAQEEPMNQGFYDYVKSRLALLLGGDYSRIRYIGRPVSSGQAPVSPNRFFTEKMNIINECLSS